MKLRHLLPLLVALVAAGAVPAAASASPADETVDITMRAAPAGPVVPSAPLLSNPSVWLVDPADNPETTAAPGVAGCTLSVSDHNANDVVDGVDVLDQAEAEDCISEWSGRNDESCLDGSDVFVATVDGLSEVYPATYWLVQRGGELASTGVCDMALTDGEDVSFVYQ